MIKLKYYLRCLIKIIKYNIGTFILLIVGLSSLLIGINIDEVEVKYRIVKYDKIGNEYLYIIDQMDDGITKYELLVKEKPLIKNPYIDYMISDFATILYIIASISLMLFFILILINICENKFIPADFASILLSKVRIEYENNMYYYFIYNRFIGKDKNKLTNYDIKIIFNILNLNDVLRCPIYKTKGQKREELLSKLKI
ncbi:MAG: hypothetical protein M0R46_06415 [Candidatus Muirbacterium halophilum]|nr:hypothetical protein [Candidatus Muirbacterium halophilum]